MAPIRQTWIGAMATTIFVLAIVATLSLITRVVGERGNVDSVSTSQMASVSNFGDTPSPQCTFDGLLIKAPTYVLGRKGADGSVFAVCEDATLKCYVQTRHADATRGPIFETLECSTVAASRRLETKGIKVARNSKQVVSGSKRKSVETASTLGGGKRSKGNPSNLPSRATKGPAPTRPRKKSLQKAKDSEVTKQRKATTTAPKVVIIDKFGNGSTHKSSMNQNGVLPKTDTVCMHKGTRIRGLQRVGDKQGKFLLICNEHLSPPTLTCYKDRQIADRPIPDMKVPCDGVPPVPTQTKTRRTRKGGRGLGVIEEDERLWDLGVVCFEFVEPEAPTEEAVESRARSNTDVAQVMRRYTQAYNEYRRREGDLKALIRQNMQLYENEVGVVFIPSNECVDRIEDWQDETICNSCMHTVRITFEANPLHTNYGCWGSIGAMYGEPDEESSQQLNLSDHCWTNKAILHELGHTLGLWHDHQHPGREVVVVKGAFDTITDEVIDNYAIDDRHYTGEYDRSSIMHYEGGGLCVPTANFNATVFCDVDETPERNGCVDAVREIHCDPDQDNTIGNAQRPNEEDIQFLRRIYADAFELRSNQFP